MKFKSGKLRCKSTEEKGRRPSRFARPDKKTGVLLVGYSMAMFLFYLVLRLQLQRRALGRRYATLNETSSTMFSKVITVYLAVNVISAVNGFIDSKLRVLEPVLKCYEISGEKVMAALYDLDPETDRENLKLSCVSNEEFNPCLADLLKKTPSPVPKVFLFYGAVAYQTSYLLKKAKLCPGIKYDDLKRIVLDSGITEKEGLSNIENDRYHRCVRDVMEKCLIKTAQVFEHEEGDPDEGDDTVDASIRCIEEQTKTCNHPIMRHFFEQIEAYKKHVKQLELLESEEQQG